MDHWRRLDRIIGHLEKVLLSVMLAAMILLAFLQIVLRNFFDTGLPWGDSLVRYLVLWVGFIGAALATNEESHPPVFPPSPATENTRSCPFRR